MPTCAYKKIQTFDSHFRQNDPWKTSQKAFSEVLLKKWLYGQTELFVLNYGSINSYSMSIVVMSPELFDLWRSKNWHLWFWAIYRRLPRRNFRGTEKGPAPWHATVLLFETHWYHYNSKQMAQFRVWFQRMIADTLRVLQQCRSQKFGKTHIAYMIRTWTPKIMFLNT